MKVIFGTTNPRKVEDLNIVIKEFDLDIEVQSLADIGWGDAEIEESGTTLEENSLIKARAIYEFCQKKGITDPIITDDAGLYVEALNGEPGIYTARYADKERQEDPTLPKYECVNKLLRKLESETNRNAQYRCVVTCMYSNGEYFQVKETSDGVIAEEIVQPIINPYFYTVFVLNDTNKTLNNIPKDERSNLYRYKAFEKVLKKI